MRFITTAPSFVVCVTPLDVLHRNSGRKFNVGASNQIRVGCRPFLLMGIFLGSRISSYSSKGGTSMNVRLAFPYHKLVQECRLHHAYSTEEGLKDCLG